MKAKKIFEAIGFERGQDPLKSVGIGQEAIKRKILEETEWDIPFQPEQVIDVYEYKGFPVAIIEMNFKKYYIGNAPKPTYRAVTHKNATFFNEGKTKWFKTIMGAKRDLHNRLNYLIELKRIKARVRGVKESYNFERGKDPKEAINIGLSSKVLYFLNWVRNDYQFDKSDPDNYYGYINLSQDGFTDSKLSEGFRLFVKDWRRYLKTMKDMGLYIFEEPSLEETIIHDSESLKTGMTPITESIDFERGLNPKRAVGIGGLRSFKSLIIDGANFLKKNPTKWHKWIAIRDSILNQLPDDFMDDLKTDEEALERIFWERPDLKKALIAEMNNLLSSNESYNFERGQDPYDSLTIGKKALLQKKAMDIQWDWYPDSEEEEEIVDIQPYKDFNIKVATDLESADPQYYAVSDTGEPYIYGPILFKTPEEALEHQKEFLDEYLEENK